MFWGFHSTFRTDVHKIDQARVAVLVNAVANTPAMAETKAHLGWTLRHLGRDADALLRLREAIRLLPLHPNDRLEMLATSQAAALLAARGQAYEEESRGYLERAQVLLQKHGRSVS